VVACGPLRGARFVTFEGLDGSGKSTQLELAARWLADSAVPHAVTHEPGGTALGQRLRDLFLDAGSPDDAIVEALLLFASRRLNLEQVIEPALAAGRHVLCDRFTDSTVAYQAYGRGLALDTVRQLEMLTIGGRRPDLTLWFDVDLDVARSRRGAGERPDDRLDAESRAFRLRVRQGYVALAAAEPQRIVRIDADRGLEEVASRVRETLAERLGLPGA